MSGAGRAVGRLLGGAVPPALRARLSKRLKARMRALLGIEPWPDLAVRHPLFRSPEYRSLRAAASPFDVDKPGKPVLERGHQASYLVAKWFAEAGMRSAFHAGFANGRYLFYLERLGVEAGGVDLPDADTTWVTIPADILEGATMRRLLRHDFLTLTEADVRLLWGSRTVDVLFSEATFETMLPWRPHGASVPGYLELTADERRDLAERQLPAAVARQKGWAQSMIFIEPEPAAGGAGTVFAACARLLPDFAYSVWGFRPPFDRLFRLSPRHPARQTLYTFTRGGRLLDVLRAYAAPL